MIVAFLVVLVLLAAYGLWRYLIALAIGRTAGAIERRRRPVTDEEYRAVADERAARDALRPHGSLEALATVYAPANNGKEDTE